MWSLFTRSPTKAKVQLQGVSSLELMSRARRYARRCFCADVASGSMLLGNKGLDIPRVAVINCAMGATNGWRETHCQLCRAWSAPSMKKLTWICFRSQPR